MQHCIKPALVSLCRSVAQLQPSPLVCAVPTLFSMQSRKTHVVKKITVIKLQNPDAKKGPDLQQAHKETDERYIYESVRYDGIAKMKPINVLLLSTVEGVGVQGEVVSMSPNKARKNILLPKLGVYASPDNLQRYAHLKGHQTDDMPSSMFARKTVAHLGGLVLTVTMNIHEPWELEPWHLRVSFRKAEVRVPEYAIQLPDEPIRGPNMDYQNKFFYVTVTVNNREKVRVMCALHHVSGDPKYRLPWSDGEHLKTLPMAVLPSQQAYLAAMYSQRLPYTALTEDQITPEMAAQSIHSTAPTVQ